MRLCKQTVWINSGWMLAIVYCTCKVGVLLSAYTCKQRNAEVKDQAMDYRERRGSSLSGGLGGRVGGRGRRAPHVRRAMLRPIDREAVADADDLTSRRRRMSAAFACAFAFFSFS